MTRLLTLREVAAALRLSYDAARDLVVERREIPHVRPAGPKKGAHVLVSEEELEIYIASKTIQKTP